jgi:glycosyltransferase involved in cell wall biosynthesis
MKVLMMHNRYVQSGGEDVAFEQDAGLLRDNGHDVYAVERTNTDINLPNLPSRAGLFASTVWSHSVYRQTRRIIRNFHPDVLHVHNFLPLVSPSVYYAAWHEDTPVVQSLHNYRLICPSATLFRDGRVCTDCVGHAPLPGVIHACYRGSPSASFAVATLLQTHRLLRTWHRVDAYIAVSQFVKQTMIASGVVPRERVHVKPNFVSCTATPRVGVGEFALFVGRLSIEKGLPTLLRAWIDGGGGPMDFPLKLVGSGPLEGALRETARAAGDRVEFLGAQPRQEVMRLMANARLVIAPSESWDSMPLVALEALAAGVPVVATTMGGFLESVEHEKTGLHVQPGNAPQLAHAARRLIEDVPLNVRMGSAARQVYLERYSAQPNYQRLIEIYELARRRRLARSGSREASCR